MNLDLLAIAKLAVNENSTMLTRNVIRMLHGD
jgi:hypothetical protein